MAQWSAFVRSACAAHVLQLPPGPVMHSCATHLSPDRKNPALHDAQLSPDARDACARQVLHLPPDPWAQPWAAHELPLRK